MKKISFTIAIALICCLSYAQENYDLIKNSTIGASTATVLSQDDIPITHDTTKIVAVIIQILVLVLPFFKKKPNQTPTN